MTTATAAIAVRDQRGNTPASSAARAAGTRAPDREGRSSARPRPDLARRKSTRVARPPIQTATPSTCTVRIAVASHASPPTPAWPDAAWVPAMTRARPQSSATARRPPATIACRSGIASSSARILNSTRCPNLVCNVVDSGAQRASADNPCPAPYGPWTSNSPTAAASVTPHPAHSSRRGPSCRSPAGQSASRKKPAPSRTDKPAKAPKRTTPASTLTAAEPLLVDTDAAALASGATPTPKKKLPETGWLSAEMTCQLTTYVPRPRSADSPATTWLPVCPWRTSPASTRWPVGEMTVIERASVVTDSLKASVTCDGGTVRVAPATGSLRSSTACADAGPAVAISAATTATSRNPRRRMPRASITAPVSLSPSSGPARSPCPASPSTEETA